MYKTTIEDLTHKDGIFDVKVGYFPEDLHPEDLFDNSLNPETDKPYFDTDEMARRIDQDLDAWFGCWVTYYYQGHEVGSSRLGGLYYENEFAEDVIEKEFKENGCFLQDIIHEAREQAKSSVQVLYKNLERDIQGAVCQ